MADNMEGIKIKALPETTELTDDVDLIVEDTTPKTWRAKLSLLAKKIIGEVDISEIGDGTCTGAIATIEKGLSATNSVLEKTNSDLSSLKETKSNDIIIRDATTENIDITNGESMLLKIPTPSVEGYTSIGVIAAWPNNQAKVLCNINGWITNWGGSSATITVTYRHMMKKV